MFAVLFDVEPREDRWDDYLHYADVLRPELLGIDGFQDNRRFRSRRFPGRLLSLSLWRDEKAVIRWRTHGGHHGIQAIGRSQVFRTYRLRVGEVTREAGSVLPQMRFDETAIGLARAATVLEAPAIHEPPAAAGLVDWDRLDGITVPGSSVMTLFWRDHDAMMAWAAPDGGRRLDVRIVRDYGLHERTEAPQFHVAVPE